MKVNSRNPRLDQTRCSSRGAQEDCLVAAGKSDISGLDWYLEQGGLVDEKLYTTSWPMGVFPLTIACISYQPKSVRWLLERGANPNKVKIKDEWLLISVIAMNQLDIFSELIDKCSLDIKSKHGCSVLEIAEMSAHCPDGERIYDDLKAISRKRKRNTGHQEDVFVLTKKSSCASPEHRG